MRSGDQRLALAMASVLRRSWAKHAPASSVEVDLGHWARRLVEGGAAGLAWWRIRES